MNITRNILVLYLCLFLSIPFQAFAQQRSFQPSLNTRSQGQQFSTDGSSNPTNRSFNPYEDMGQGNVNNQIPNQNQFNSLGGGAQKNPIFYSIHVLGNVKFPGSYKILPSDKLSDAINYAGGLLPTGSERKIQLRRNGVYEVKDLYLYKYQAMLSQNPFLMENDVIYIPAKSGEVQIEGPVNRPGNYEILTSITLQKIISMAGGFTSGLSKKDPIRIIRYNQNEKKEVLQIENHPDILKTFIVKKSDIVVLPHILLTKNKFDYDTNRIPGDNIFFPTRDDNVYVIGSVSQPGPYPFHANWSFKEYVSLAGPTRKLSMRKIQVFTRDGQRKTLNIKTIINPGDTLIVPEQKWTIQTIVGITSSILGLTLAAITLRNEI